MESSNTLRWVCGACGGPRVPGLDGPRMAPHARIVADLARARRTRDGGRIVGAISLALAVMALLALAPAGLVWPASHLATAIVAGTSLLIGAVAVATYVLYTRSKRDFARALDDAWTAAAAVVGGGQAAITAPDLAVTMRVSDAVAERLLSNLSASSRARVDVGEDAELRYRIEDAAHAPQEALPVADARDGHARNCRTKRRSNMSERPRIRRSLTNVGGAIRVAGDEEDAKLLSHALDVPIPDPEAKDDESLRAHVHGFHTYPARMHPVTAARLVRAFSPERGVVLDPFCGSGTVLVEALTAGRDALGTDLNPLAVRLARTKTRPRGDAELEALVAHARDCADLANERRKERRGATRRFPEEDMHVFDPHVLLELDSLRAGHHEDQRLACAHGSRAGLERAPREALSKARRHVRGSRRAAPRGGVSHEALREEDRGAHAPPSRIHAARPDASAARARRGRRRDEAAHASGSAAPADRRHHHVPLRTSPPTTTSRITRSASAGSTSTRVPWSNRSSARADASRRWSPRRPTTRGRASSHRSSPPPARLLPRGAPMVLLMADSAIGREAIRADEVVASVARRSGFVPAAMASQTRTHFHGATSGAFAEEPRAEHALLVRRL